MLVPSCSREGVSFWVRCDLPLASFCGNGSSLFGLGELEELPHLLLWVLQRWLMSLGKWVPGKFASKLLSCGLPLNLR